MKNRVIILLLMLCVGSSAFALNRNKILVVSSYGTDYQWSNSIIDKLNFKVRSSFPGVELNVEYLSSEMFTNTDTWIMRMQTIISNYEDEQPLAIVLISDEAWMAYRAVDTEHLRDVPLILCAVKPHSITIESFENTQGELKLSQLNSTQVVMGNYNATGVLRRMNVEGYLRLMNNVLPGLDNFVFITDKRFYGQYINLMLKEKVDVLFPDYPVEYISAVTTKTDMLIKRLSEIKPTSGLLLSSWLTGEHGYEYSKDFIYKHMESLLKTPIFITNDIGLQNGYFLGGYFNEAAFWGDKCGNKLLSIIKGVKAKTIPVDTYYDEQCFMDWNMVHKYNLKTSNFPKGTFFINKPESVFVKYRNTVIFAGFIFFIIIASYIYVLRSHLNLQRAQKTTLRSVELANEANERLREVKNNLTIALEKAEESDRLKSSFISNMSHEIRTPLNAIVGFSGIIATMDSEEERLEFATIIQKNSDLLLQLISDILNISKLDSGMLELSCVDVDAGSICQDIVVAQHAKCGDNVELKFVANEARMQIYVDCGYITQILTNFVINAIKFTNNGIIEIGYVPYGDDQIEFYVKDSGIGIESDKITTIFDRFVKLNSYVEGTGLGLALCKTIVEILGGEIGVESEVGVGSRFWFRINRKINCKK